METTLVVVTLVSLALAVTMGALAWRVVALDRRREAARVAALAALAGEDDLPLAVAEHAIYADRAHTPEHAESAERRGATHPQIFSHEEHESPAGRRLVAVAAVAAVMAAGVGALLFARGSAHGRDGADLQTAARASEEGDVRAPLELVSLRHERTGDRLTITGLVRNPPGGARVERANAVAFVFDPNGTFIASGRALVDFVTLDPGDESPFVVTVTAPGRVGRYRVGFRRQDGAVVSHVDRRRAVI